MSALTLIREAIRLDPSYPRAHLNLGNVLQAGGDLQGAISATMAAIQLDEKYAEAHYNLARMYTLTGDSASAAAHYLKALELRPRFPEAAVAYACHLEAVDCVTQAQSWLRRALDDDPCCEAAAFNLCRMLIAEGNVEEAEQVLRRAVAANPQLTEAFCALGDISRAQARHDEAIDWYAEALAVGRLHPRIEHQSMLAGAAAAMGIMLIHKDRWQEADVALRESIKLAPGLVDPYVNLAYMEMRKGRPVQAAEYYRKAIAADPNAIIPRSYLLFALNMVDDVDAQEIFAEHRQFGEWLERAALPRIHEHRNGIDSERPLRVGYMSADYRVHPVAQFIVPILEGHDAERVQPFCYSNTRERDHSTAELETRFAGIWRDVTAMNDDDVAALVREDGIDILIDLSGHTGNGRLSVFAQKPAPIQIAWLGYLNTTGLKSMDYRLVDRHTDPSGVADELHSERLVRLPDSQWAYRPLLEVPVTRPDRSSDLNKVVFGSFNQFAKLSDRCLELWAQVMKEVPEAQLRIAGLPPGPIEGQLLRRMERVGIAPDRVSVARRVPQMQYMQSFNEVDIALDSMPYNGATTTLDTLWMGVPVVGLVGTRSISRGTYSILKTLRMDELIAASPEQYVQLNVRLATDFQWRDQLHRSLREKLRRSPLMDVPRFVENLETAYRGMWREWCVRQMHAKAS